MESLPVHISVCLVKYRLMASKLLKSGKNLVVVKVVSKTDGSASESGSAAIVSSILLFVRVKRKMGKYQRRVIF